MHALLTIMTAVQDRYKIADDLRDDYAIGESKACIYVLLSSWAEEGLGHGRCGVRPEFSFILVDM